MTKITPVAVAIFAAALSVPFAAQAASITITGINAEWVNVRPAAVSVDNSGATKTLRWGAPASSAGQSGYDFTGIATPVTPDVNAPFELGEFVHLNNPVYAPALAATSLKLTFDGDLDGTAFSIASLVDFAHRETPNNNSCGFISTSTCDDFVTISLNTAGTDVVSVEGVDYVFNILGFRTSLDGDIITTFQTLEENDNVAQLYGEFTEYSNVAPVPLPAALPLALIGFAGLGLVGRRRR